MDIELRLLRSFAAIYEHGSLSRAAGQLNLTQAAMSMRLKLIETELGETLFLRRHHRLEPTSRASELYAKALGVLSAYDEMISLTRSHKPRQKVRFGLPDDYALGILPRVLERLGSGGYEIEIVCDLSANLAAAVERQQVDMALVTLAAPPAKASFAVELGLCWVMASDGASGAAPDNGGSLPLAAYPEGCVFRAAMTGALDAARLPWHIAAQSRNHAGIVAAVRAGIAVTAMAKGTAPQGLAEIAEASGLPPLPPVPIHVLGNAPAHLARLLADELATLAATESRRYSA